MLVKKKNTVSYQDPKEPVELELGMIMYEAWAWLGGGGQEILILLLPSVL